VLGCLIGIRRINWKHSFFSLAVVARNRLLRSLSRLCPMFLGVDEMISSGKASSILLSGGIVLANKLVNWRETFRTLMNSGYLPVFSMNILLQMLGFSSTVMVAKFLLPTELAMVKTAQAYASVAVILAGVGLTAPVMRFCADSRFDEEAQQAMLRTALRAVAWASLTVVAMILLVVSGVLGLDVQSGRVYAIYALVLPALALTGLLYVYLQARQQFGALAKNQSLIKLASVCLVVWATYAWGLYGLLVMTIVVGYLGLLPLLRLTLFSQRKSKLCMILPSGFYRFAFYGMAGMFISALGQASDFILMDLVGTERSDVGRYSLASVFFLGAATITGSIQAVITPRFTTLLPEPLQFMVYLRGWIPKIVMLSLAVACITVATGWILQTWFFGEKYVGFVDYLAILMLKYIFWSSYAVVGAAMLGAGIIKSGTWVAVGTTIVSFVLGYPLCKWWGATGAAIAQVGVTALSLGVILWVQKLEFNRLFGMSLRANR
jgi:O-antigen/teichoic acid export membrane protein